MIKRRIISFLIGAVVSFTLFLLLGAKREGEKPLVGFEMIMYKGGNECWHIHHWIYMMVLAVLMTITILVAKGKYTVPIMLVYGVLLGASLSDLRYRDVFQIKVPCNTNKLVAVQQKSV